MKFTPNANAIELLNLTNAVAVRFDPLSRARQKRTNLKVRPLVSAVKATNQAKVNRITNDLGTFTNFRIPRESLDNLGVTKFAKKRYLLKFFGAGYYELLPVSQNYQIQPNDAIIQVR